jgi:RNA polymerase sigma-70 factor (ECF subfamily)
VERAVASLPARCQEVFRLNRYQRLSYAEVAQVMQISVKTVEMQMGRALVALRSRLAEWRS